ncbi:MAG: NUDIX domain-containing protein [Candidatus Thiodiazotropha sp.]
MSLPTVDDLAKQSPAGKFASGTGPMLVSSGVLLWLNGRLAVTRRSHDARYDPGHWTTPAGRCDSTPRITAFKEAAEEIQVRQPDTGQIWIPREAHKSLQDKAKEYPTKLGFPPPITAPLVTVQTFLDDTQIEECQMWACFVAHCNTLELRLPLVAQLPFEPELSNPEYGTPALILSHTELRRRDLVPALAFFLEEVQQYEYE